MLQSLSSCTNLSLNLNDPVPDPNQNEGRNQSSGIRIKMKGEIIRYPNQNVLNLPQCFTVRDFSRYVSVNVFLYLLGESTHVAYVTKPCIVCLSERQI